MPERGKRNGSAVFSKTQGKSRRVVFGGMILMVIGAVAVQACLMTRSEAQKLFITGNLAYTQGKFEEAGRQYERIFEGGWESGPLYYNWANTFFKRGDWGRAILNYERARRFLPRDPDVISNLRFARRKAGVSASSSPWMLRSWEKLTGFLSREEWERCVLVFWIGWVMSLWIPWIRPEWQRGARRWGGLSLVVVVISALAWGQTVFKETNRFLVVDKTSALFEPREGATPHFSLPPGSPVKVTDEEGDWVKIERDDGKKGWVPRRSVEALVPEVEKTGSTRCPPVTK